MAGGPAGLPDGYQSGKIWPTQQALLTELGGGGGGSLHMCPFYGGGGEGKGRWASGKKYSDMYVQFFYDFFKCLFPSMVIYITLPGIPFRCVRYFPSFISILKRQNMNKR
jgi:hypothetical protein